MSELPSQNLSLGHAVLDVAARELVVDGKAVRLEPRLFAVLTKLADADGAAVTRDELLECWGEEAGSDEALTQAISMLRRVLGDTARPHRVIQTLPKSGYRLVRRTSSAAAHETRAPLPVRPVAVVQTMLDRPFTTLGLALGLATIALASVAAVEAITYRPPAVDVVVHVPAGPVEVPPDPN